MNMQMDMQSMMTYNVDIVFYIDQILEYYFLDSILHMAEKELLFEGKLSHDSFLNAVDLFANLESQRDSCKENFSHLVNGIFSHTTTSICLLKYSLKLSSHTYKYVPLIPRVIRT